MYDKDDHFGRWVQFFCAIPLLLIGGGFFYMSWKNRLGVRFDSNTNYTIDAAGVGLFLLGARCLWYAATGKGNVNKDDF